jgi:tetratricopeptide (TPR) repeat protein
MAHRSESPRKDQPKATQLLERGFRLEQAGTAMRAVEAYREALASHPSREEEAEAHLRISRAQRSLAQWDEAVKHAREAVRLALELGDENLAAEALNAEIGVDLIRGDFDQADALGRRALAEAQTARVRGITLQNIGSVAAARKDFPAASRMFEESIAAFREAGYELGIAIALNNAAVMARETGDPHRALELSRESATICRRLNALNVLLTAVQNQARALVELGSFDEAEGLLTEALGHFTSARNVVEQAACLESLGDLSAVRRGDVQTAERCYERALDLANTAQDRVLADRLRSRLEQLRLGGGTAA